MTDHTKNISEIIGNKTGKKFQPVLCRNVSYDNKGGLKFKYCTVLVELQEATRTGVIFLVVLLMANGDLRASPYE